MAHVLFIIKVRVDLILLCKPPGVKTFCNATQPHITTQCFGSLGGTVKVQLPKTSQDDIYKLKKDNVVVLSKSSETTNFRYSFNISTGIFAIKDIDWSDYGTYSMEVHDAAGREVATTKCNLTIQGEELYLISVAVVNYW